MYDIPFISMTAINRELPTSTLRRWDDERRRNTDVQTDDRLQIRKVDESTTGLASKSDWHR